MDYVASRTALLHPELQPSLFKQDQRWPIVPTCAELSRLAYIKFEESDQDRKTLQDVLASVGIGEPTFFTNAGTGTQAFAATALDQSSAFIVFRGTQSNDPTDLGTDLDVILTEWTGSGKVHAGFANAFHSVWDQVRSWAENSGAGNVWVTGHSLGAALATLAAAKLKDANLITFGSPRVGDADFADSFADRSVERYVDCCDLVTELPPPELGYQHLNGERYIDRFGDMPSNAASESKKADREIARAIYIVEQGWRTGNVPIRDLADHAPINYVRAVLKGKES